MFSIYVETVFNILKMSLKI